MPAFDADKIISMALRQAGNRETDTALVAVAEDELNLLIFELEEAPDPFWFLLSEWSLATCVIDVSVVPLPVDFLLEDEDSHLYLVDAAGVESQLVKDDADSLKNKYLNAASAVPKAYAFTGEYFELFPAPSLGTYQLKMRYFQSAVELTIGNVRTNKWTVNTPDLLIAMLGQKIINGYLQENGVHSQSLQMAEARARRRVQAKDVAVKVANQILTMGD
jgi:hypothetical protein